MVKRTVIILPSVAHYLRSVCRPYAAIGVECGGHLFGRRQRVCNEEEVFVVVSASGVGVNSVCESNRFQSDAHHANRALNLLQKCLPRLKCEVLGEWHLHPMALHQLSDTDDQALSEAVHDTDPYVAVLLSQDTEDLRCQAFIAERTGAGARVSTAALIDDDSEFEASLGEGANRISMLTDQFCRLHGELWNTISDGGLVDVLPAPGGFLCLVHGTDGTIFGVAPDHGSGIPTTYAWAGADWQALGHSTSADHPLLARVLVALAELERGDIEPEPWRVQAPTELLDSLTDEPRRLSASVRTDERWIALDDGGDQIVHWKEPGELQLVPGRDGFFLHHADGTAPVHAWDPGDAGVRERAVGPSARVDGARIAVVGLGSIGSRLALRAAAMGIQVLGFDNGRFKAANAWPRYPYMCDLSSLVGRRKADLVQQQERLSLGTSNIKTADVDICANNEIVEYELRSFAPDLLIACTDTWDSRIDMAAIGRRLGVAQLHIGFSDAAKSIEIGYFGVGEDDPCPGCRLVGDGAGTQQSLRRQSRNYGSDPAGVPALNANIEFGAAAAFRLVVGLLAENQSDAIERWFCSGDARGNLIWLSAEPETWITEDAFQVVIARVAKNPECPICARGCCVGMSESQPMNGGRHAECR